MAFRQRVAAPSAEKLGARFLVVQLQSTILAIWAETVRGVLTTADVQPGSSVVLLGESYEHSQLAARLHLREQGVTVDSRYVLCAHGQARCVVPVDRVLGLTDIRRQDILPLPAMLQGNERLWYRGIFLFQDGLALVLNPDWLLHEAESASQVVALTS
ncbi:hypothetical protein YTPLAS18_22940 [Nitrospira sp.]|nr:hypothetical protein YTPLAS18_22940 [Nitrospira sp.]